MFKSALRALSCKPENVPYQNGASKRSLQEALTSVTARDETLFSPSESAVCVQIDPDILEAVVRMGFDRATTIESLRRREHNKVCLPVPVHRNCFSLTSERPCRLALFPPLQNNLWRLVLCSSALKYGLLSGSLDPKIPTLVRLPNFPSFS